MKNSLSTSKSILSLLVLLAGMTISNVSYAQENTIKTNLANLALAGGSIHYERVLGESTTAQLGLFITSISVDDTKFSGFGIIPQYRYYPGQSNVVPHGFFIAPLLGYQVFSLETPTSGGSSAKASYSLFGGGFDIGNQWLVSRSLSIELSAGISFNSTSLSIETSGATEDEFSIGGFGSTTPRLGVSLGYAF
ncbi:MAG: DUF3575 domain-containing protein [Balneolales bacterium]